MDIERKTVKFEVKAIDEETGIFEGYAATFSDKPDSYGDIIDPGAFTKTLKVDGNRIKILWQHNVNEPIGKPAEIAEDAKGLHVKGKLSLGVQRAREVLSLMKDGVITEMSIGYDTLKQTFSEGIRHLKEVRIYDVSPVSFAANPEAVIVGVKQTELKPYENEHACRLRDPDDFQEGSFRRTTRVSDGKKYSVIMGRLEGETTMTEQAYRYDKETWEETEAKNHCKEHDGQFESAEKNLTFIDQAETVLAAVNDWISRTKSLADLRRKEGRVLSTANRKRLASLLEALGMVAIDIKELLDATEPEVGEKLLTMLSEFQAESEGFNTLERLLVSIEAEIEGFDVKQANARIDALLSK